MGDFDTKKSGNPYSSFGNNSSFMRPVNVHDSLSHINQLIDMAEESKNKITNLYKQLKKMRERMLILIAFAYICIGFFVAFISEQYKSLSNLPSSYTILTLVIVILILAFALFTYRNQRSAIRLQIAMERGILKDILGLVFDIRKLLDISAPTGSLWLEFKVVDMRLRRLEFY
jgi:membrane protein insertase Oxa1/YidC/SpoIIIJ